ncbi:MAG: hypothetical protein ACYS9T_07560 [Planctomycetota bacterium]
MKTNERQQKRRALRWRGEGRRGGFVFILVVTAMAVIGTMMLALTALSNTMLFESDTAYLQASERDLALSGLGWAEWNIKNRRKEVSERTTELDVGDMGIDGASLSVSIGVPGGQEVEVQVKTMCSHRRRTLRHSEKYRIKL